MPATSNPSLTPLLAPRSVAVVGASDRPGNRGGTAVSLLRKFGYAGGVHPVHPTATAVGGYPAVPTVADLPDDVDVAIVGLGATRVPDAVREIGKAGIPGVITWAGGFAEGGPEGAELQRQLDLAVQESGVRLIGPNCLGVVNTGIHFTGTFASWLRRSSTLSTSGISMVSQSGGLAAAAHAWAEESGVGFRYMVSTGNEVDVSVVDVLEFFVQEPETTVILAYLEGAEEGGRLIDALAAAREAGKPVVLLKVGHSAASAAAIAAHTGALAGETRVWDDLLADVGAIQVRSVEQLLDTAGYLHSRLGRPPVAGNRLAVLGFGGGVGVLGADQAGFAGLEVPELGADIRARLAPLIPEIASSKNPVDLTPEAFSNDRYRAHIPEILDIIDSSGEIDVMLTSFGTGEWFNAEEIAGAVARFATTGNAAVAVYSRPLVPEAAAIYRDAGVQVFPSQHTGIEVLGRIAGALPRRSARADTVVAAARRRVRPLPANLALPEATDGDVFPEARVHELLAAAGFNVLRGVTVTSAGPAGEAADAIGYPVVMKVLSQKITHRASAGLVRVGVGDRAAVEAAFAELADRTAALGGDLQGVFVQEMAAGGFELLVSAFRDPVFGPVISVGAGGVLTELIDDVRFARSPLDEESALRLLEGLRVAGRPKGLDLDQVGPSAVAFLVRFSALVQTLPWRQFVLELNPVSLSADRAIALDGLMIIGDATRVDR